MSRILLTGISELVSNGPLRDKSVPNRVIEADLGLARDRWIFLADGKVVAVGGGDPPSQYGDGQVINLTDLRSGGTLVMPGLIDSHTHPIFGGDRSAEFYQRLNGATYQEIAAAGGGIQSTVRGTRSATDDELLESGRKRIEDSVELGVTSIEVKSGYGLSFQEELRHLRLITRLRDEFASRGVTISRTCLALHAVGPEAGSQAEYIEQIEKELIPAVVSEDLAEWFDAFVEKGYFEPDHLDGVMAAAKAAGLGIRIHADEFADSGAASAAARWGAQSADHLQAASDEGIKAMAEAGVVATFLPGTSLYTAIPYVDGRKFADQGVPVAVATDFNPGSCFLNNLSMLASVSALHCGLRPAEVVAGVTFVPAFSLGLNSQKGALVPGMDADLVVWPHETVAHWLADMGQKKPLHVIAGGKLI